MVSQLSKPEIIYPESDGKSIAVLQLLLKVLSLAILDSAVLVTALGGTCNYQFECDRHLLYIDIFSRNERKPLFLPILKF